MVSVDVLSLIFRDWGWIQSLKQLTPACRRYLCLYTFGACVGGCVEWVSGGRGGGVWGFPASPEAWEKVAKPLSFHVWILWKISGSSRIWLCPSWFDFSGRCHLRPLIWWGKPLLKKKMRIQLWILVEYLIHVSYCASHGLGEKKVMAWKKKLHRACAHRGQQWQAG